MQDCLHHTADQTAMMTYLESVMVYLMHIYFVDSESQNELQGQADTGGNDELTQTVTAIHRLALDGQQTLNENGLFNIGHLMHRLLDIRLVLTVPNECKDHTRYAPLMDLMKSLNQQKRLAPPKLSQQQVKAQLAKLLVQRRLQQPQI
jgi:hypothetical protein